jgi:hypothetical protein
MALGTTHSADKQLDMIAKGRDAVIVAGLMRPFIDLKVEQLIQLAIRDYRNKNLTHDGMIGTIAEISALKGLLTDLERTHKAGVAVMEKEYAREIR